MSTEYSCCDIYIYIYTRRVRMGRRLLMYFVADHKSFHIAKVNGDIIPIIAAKGFIRCGMVTQNKHTQVRCRPCKTIESCRYLSHFLVGRRLIIIINVGMHNISIRHSKRVIPNAVCWVRDSLHRQPND